LRELRISSKNLKEREKEMLRIVIEHKDFELYLNHSCLNTLSFGSEDMAWTTNYMHEAVSMLKRCKKKHLKDAGKMVIESL